MEIMVRLVQIRIIFIIVVTLFTTNYITAQHKIDRDITFSFKGKKSYVSLNSFLANYKFDDEKLGKCVRSFGIIRFQITPKGKIVLIDTEGNLPDVLIEAIKKRILLTEDHWIFSDSILKSGKNIEFYYPFYLDIDLEENCNINGGHESYMLLKRLFDNQKVLHIRDEIYYIEPDFYISQR